MATAAKARPKASNDAERVALARKLIATTRRKASQAAHDQQTERSTRARRALKIKADALEQISDVLAGKT